MRRKRKAFQQGATFSRQNRRAINATELGPELSRKRRRREVESRPTKPEIKVTGSRATTGSTKKVTESRPMEPETKVTGW